MTVTKQGEATFYYFLGDPKTIYSNYKKVREEQGYQDVKPKFRLFEVGWESWDALGWNTNQFTVQEILQKFHEMDTRSDGRLLDLGFGLREVRQQASGDGEKNSQMPPR